MGVRVREKVKGSGIWWVFARHNRKRKSRQVGTFQAAQAVREQWEKKLSSVDLAGDAFTVFETPLVDAALSPCLALRGSELLAWRQPLIYLWRRGNEVLYVGSSIYGLQRPLDRTHHQVRLENIRGTDRFEFRFYPGMSEKDLRAAEQVMIRTLKPTLNQVRFTGRRVEDAVAS